MVVVPEKKKRKCVVAAARVAVIAKKQAQSKALTATARFEQYEKDQPGDYWRIPI